MQNLYLEMHFEFLKIHFDFLKIHFDFLEMHFKKLKIHLQNYDDAFFVQIKWVMVLKFKFIKILYYVNKLCLQIFTSFGYSN
jgi:hypothetical protein